MAMLSLRWVSINAVNRATRAMMTHVCMITHNANLQQNLPQYFLASKRCLTQTALHALDILRGQVIFLRRKSAWNTGFLMVQILRRLARVVEPYRDTVLGRTTSWSPKSQRVYGPENDSAAVTFLRKMAQLQQKAIPKRPHFDGSTLTFISRPYFWGRRSASFLRKNASVQWMCSGICLFSYIEVAPRCSI